MQRLAMILPAALLATTANAQVHDFAGSAPWHACPENLPANATVVKAFDGGHHHVGPEGDFRTLRESVTFPSDGTWQQIGLKLELTCPESGLCDHWDRRGLLRMAYEQDGVTQLLELYRFITPYRVGMCTYTDLTPLADVLKGERFLMSNIDTWAGPGVSFGEGWQVSYSFVFVPTEDDAAQEAPRVLPLWQEREVKVGDAQRAIESQLPPRTVHIPADAQRVQARLVTTGHGYWYTYNCAEFCPMRQDLYVNGQRFSVQPWRDDCAENPRNHQQGNYFYPRNGWCPGAPVLEHTIDITDAVTPGADNVLGFDIRMSDGRAYINTDAEGLGGEAREVVSVHLLID